MQKTMEITKRQDTLILIVVVLEKPSRKSSPRKSFKTCNISNDLDSDDVSDNNGVNDDHDDDNATDFVIGEDDIIDIIDETHITD